VWADDYGAGLTAAATECARVLRPGRRGWFLLRRRNGTERWLSFDRESQRWEHAGFSVPARSYTSGLHWGTVPEEQLLPLILGASAAGEVVLDPFAGRGGITRLAGRLGRTAIGTDIDIGQLRGRRW